MTSLHSMLAPLLSLARDAGSLILGVYETDFTVKSKDDETPLTRADMIAHHRIESGLVALTPDIPVLSEESVRIPFRTRRQWHRYWLVDPLDGTREFVRRNGEFSINVALIDDGEPVLGVIYAPVSGICWYAWRNGGAWRKGLNQQRATRLRCGQAAQPPVVVGSNSRHGPRTRSYLNHLGAHDLIRQGSAIKFGLIAEGRADLYVRLGLTSEWDTAAGQCVVEEAGGQVTDVRLQPLRYNTKDSLLNPDFFAFGDDSRDWSAHLSDDR